MYQDEIMQGLDVVNPIRNTDKNFVREVFHPPSEKGEFRGRVFIRLPHLDVVESPPLFP
jgi:hypothetical protein